MECIISITNRRGSQLSAVTAYFGKASNYTSAESGTISTCTDVSTTVAQAANLAAGVTRRCVASVPVTATEISNNAINLWAGAKATTPATAVDKAITGMKLGVVTVAVTSPASITAPVKIGDVVPITVTITNAGPVNIGNTAGVNVTAPVVTGLTLGACANQAVAAPVSGNTSVKTCSGTYTVQSGDTGAVALTLTVAVDSTEASKLKSAVPATAALSIPVTKLTSTFTAADCAPVLVSELRSFCPLLPANRVSELC